MMANDDEALMAKLNLLVRMHDKLELYSRLRVMAAVIPTALSAALIFLLHVGMEVWVPVTAAGGVLLGYSTKKLYTWEERFDRWEQANHPKVH